METVKALRAMGAPQDEIEAKSKSGGRALSNYAQQFIESADNGLRMQNMMISLAGKTGGLH